MGKAMGKYCKGIFWFVPCMQKLMVKKVVCDEMGNAFTQVVYSSKAGTNFNHKAEWLKFPHKLTRGKPYNYYPRGRVEIKNNRAVIYMNPILKEGWIEEMIKDEFCLSDGTIAIRIIADGSAHYEYLVKL